jgi:hypothetical protein
LPISLQRIQTRRSAAKQPSRSRGESAQICLISRNVVLFETRAVTAAAPLTVGQARAARFGQSVSLA